MQQEGDPTLPMLYEWVEEEISQLEYLRSAFPEYVEADRQRLVMSFSCLNWTLKLHHARPYKALPRLAPNETGQRPRVRNPPF